MLSDRQAYHALSYVNYWLDEMDEHSLHSPFIFEFYREIIKKEKEQPVFAGFEKVRDDMLLSNRSIDVTDLGAGSAITKDKSRRLSEIAKYSMSTKKKSSLYNRIIDYFKLEHVLELGTSLGINAMYLAQPTSIKKVLTIEGCPQIAGVAQSNFDGYSSNKIELINKPINKAFTHIFNRQNSFDFILFDAHHNYSATMEYYHAIKSHIHPRSILIFDDIHWSQGMTQAWREVQSEIEVTLTIDLFHLGIVFFRKELEKENYVLSW